MLVVRREAKKFSVATFTADGGRAAFFGVLAVSFVERLSWP
jgi:hypothetical protein